MTRENREKGGGHTKKKTLKYNDRALGTGKMEKVTYLNSFKVALINMFTLTMDGMTTCKIDGVCSCDTNWTCSAPQHETSITALTSVKSFLSDHQWEILIFWGTK